jgi:general secretion pathway protein G
VTFARLPGIGVRRRERGFTFIELMMTLAIMATLAMVAVPLAQVVVQRDKEKELRRALADIRDAIDAYKKAADAGRIVMSVGDSGYPKSLADLVEGVPDQRSPTRSKIYFLRRLPKDPMAEDGREADASQWALRSYESEPDAPSAGRDVFDVASKSRKVGLNGVPYALW